MDTLFFLAIDLVDLVFVDSFFFKVLSLWELSEFSFDFFVFLEGIVFFAVSGLDWALDDNSELFSGFLLFLFEVFLVNAVCLFVLLQFLNFYHLKQLYNAHKPGLLHGFRRPPLPTANIYGSGYLSISLQLSIG